MVSQTRNGTRRRFKTIQRPINQKWSWDRILRSPYIKQAILQCFYFFEDHFFREELKNFDFYESFTVHESSLSPCVHSFKPALLEMEYGVHVLFKNFTLGFR
jgi:trehalose/maltose hydrolase-like predicted phosphorylase